MDVWLDEGYVVVSAIPEYYVRFLLGRSQNLFIVYARIDHKPVFDVRFVFLPLFDRAIRFVQVFERSESLNSLLSKVAVWHRVSNYHNFLTSVSESERDLSRDRTLASSSPHCANGHDWQS